MITASAFHGGTLRVSASMSLSRSTPRLVRCVNTTNIILTLPDPGGFREDERGPNRWLVVADGSAATTVTVKHSSGSTLITLTQGTSLDACRLHLGGSGFTARPLRKNYPRASYSSTRGSIQSISQPVRYENFSCFSGSECDLADFAGNVPLDGEDGRDLVVVPMFQDSSTIPKNQNREPIRGADLVMPSVVVLKFNEGEFEADPNHPLAATNLSPAFYEKLYNNGRPLALVYDGPASGVSSHWHHARWQGAEPLVGWGMPNDLSVVRHIWKHEVEYDEPDGTTHVLEVRFVVEHTVDPEPLVTPVGGGGQNNRTDGAWGALFMVYVFTNELSPFFEDGDRYQPVGGGGANIAFTRDDPCRWGAVVSESLDQTKKFCHPQLVIAASLPTTFESPAGQLWVPLMERKFLKEFEGDYVLHGKNREHCYLVANGSPWLDTSGCEDPSPGGVVAIRNCVFGWDISTVSFAGMSLGGDIPRSKPLEFVIIENGPGYGLTWLKPTRAGWSEDCGKLDVLGGSSISIKLCTSDRNGIDDGTGRRRWPRFLVNACAGHPDEPFEGVGGSHRCFNNNGESTSTGCCISIDQQVFGSKEVCTATTYTFDAGCLPQDVSCETEGAYETQLLAEVFDYDYLMNGNQDNRALTWSRYLHDPAQTFYSLDKTDGTDWSEDVGSWTDNGTGAMSTAVSGDPITGIYTYVPAGMIGSPDGYRDATIRARATACTSVPHGLLTNYRSGGSQTAYFGCITPTGGSSATVELCKIVSDVITVLATRSITNLNSDNVDMELEKWGSETHFRWTVSGESQEEISADDCEITQVGWPGLLTRGAATGATFTDVEVDDTSYEYVEASAAFSQNRILMSFDRRIMQGWDQCDEDTDPGCICDCSHTIRQMTFATTADWIGGGGDITLRSCPTEGDNPTVYGGDLPTCVCDGPTLEPGHVPPCVTCPGPFEALYLNIYQRCWNGAEEDEPRMCRGISYWLWDPVAAP